MTHIFFKNPHSVCSFPPLSPHLVLECSWLSLLYRKGCVYVCVCVCARVRSEQGLLNMAKLCNLLNCGGLVTKLCPTLVTTWTVACQAPLSIGFSRQEYWCGLPFPSPGDLPDPGIKPTSPALTGRFFTTEPPGNPSLVVGSR